MSDREPVDLAEVRARHKIRYDAGPVYCSECLNDDDGICDAIRLCDEVERLRSIISQTRLHLVNPSKLDVLAASSLMDQALAAKPAEGGENG